MLPHNGNLWTTYEFQDANLRGLKLGAGLQAVSRREIGFTESIKAPGYTTLNLMARSLSDFRQLTWLSGKIAT
ncbi:MAG: hypothetical protein CVV13_14705 [Gammaproteobacteria bacterium HGW-Gammaproteobacteria-3]|nr:MAG: hypothetical protein CVV13_14705 [Gammaproteobacteria bacterium HGW-Gammaproteobacteria-3]